MPTCRSGMKQFFSWFCINPSLAPGDVQANLANLACPLSPIQRSISGYEPISLHHQTIFDSDSFKTQPNWGKYAQNGVRKAGVPSNHQIQQQPAWGASSLLGCYVGLEEETPVVVGHLGELLVELGRVVAVDPAVARGCMGLSARIFLSLSLARSFPFSASWGTPPCAFFFPSTCPAPLLPPPSLLPLAHGFPTTAQPGGKWWRLTLNSIDGPLPLLETRGGHLGGVWASTRR